ncbi:hypothetical protein PYCCODRAFT_1476907 [Trametes coccinea BRFM310]|uniref:Uncharacterized protein n=1 Tax=Trametes coccinea (strain BRFM310) TaxID=1353009 RepID=A0A1Y2IQU5_TRAC3|nr:hypothetical protein PYCCODRAFT_1476907 [Trametes coccinea BRFM310]
MSSPTSTDPPYYVLIAHSQSLSNPSAPPSTTLSHPVIEYHYADDAPNSLLPQHPEEHVLVLDYDPARPGSPIVKSLSPDLAVSAVKVVDAPGAAVAGEPALRNNSMYVITTTGKPVESPLDGDEPPPVLDVLNRFKHRNAILKSILDFHDPAAAACTQQTAEAEPSPATSPQTS